MNQLKRLFTNYRKFSTCMKHCSQEQGYVLKKSVVNPTIDQQEGATRTKIDEETIALLERLSLVDCATQKGVETLEAAIEFADQILEVDTTGVEPLTTVLENIPLNVREDKVTDGDCKEDVLKNATFTEDGYFLTPPANVAEDNFYDKN